ncbi:nitric oxide reductase transcriptional regulator NorR [Rhodoferax sp. GW822-FHT02A01]|uniref:nitric oxide reductase transcriptional regulator NorR n=1 Tax=Rhodoferax sp. GW822-FHT02A01 TaxID=3141537 RepID=UPI00315D95B7
MLDSTLLRNLSVSHAGPERMQRLVSALRKHFHSDAVAVLRLHEDALIPEAVDGLVHEALGRRFQVAAHPRLAAILESSQPVRFQADCALPDPYDGLLQVHAGEPLPVHDCMGMSLTVDGALWGVLTVDALGVDTFGEQRVAELRSHALLIEVAVRMNRLEDETASLRQGRNGTSSAPLVDTPVDEEIVGQSPGMLSLLHEIDVVANSDLPVLLLGETGVGKELFARRIHRHSSRSKPLVQVNCAALPETLAESELFGHVRGAFSGASTDRAGRFEVADGGTIFLDEIGELPLIIQAKLLRTLQNGEIQRLGEDRPRRVNVRVIVATNRDLKLGVKDGMFRADLYHRLSVYPVHIPPLRERGNDALLLAGRFLELNRVRLGIRSLRLSSAAETEILRYQWPGNVRELEHVISRAAIKALSRGARASDIVTLAPDLLDLDTSLPKSPTPQSDPLPAVDTIPVSLNEAVAQRQREMIQQALALTGSNWALAARRLGLDASNLHKLARRLGLK